MTGLNKRTLLICFCLFALAFAVRLVVWQNNKAAIDAVQYVVTEVYKQDARLLVAGDVRGFLAGPDPPSDSTIIMHPPGYPLLIAVVFGSFGENGSLRIIQILLNSLAAILAFLIARRFFGERTAIIAGMLTAFAPQFAYHSAIILPDELGVLPILLGLYFFVRAWQEKRLAMAVLCGISLGLSCWLRSNALLLPVFFAAAVFVFSRGWRLKPAFALLVSFLLAVAPITIRNYAVFNSFVPISVGLGTTFVEGLAEMDNDTRAGLPATDEGVMEMEAANFGRPDYYGNLYSPDGIAREHGRLVTGLAVIRENPGWYAANVPKRGLMAFRMERVPVIEPNYDERDTTPASLYFLDTPLKFIQRAFVTAVFLPLFLLGGLLLLSDADSRRKLALLLTVPLYFFLIQPLIHTEYRYLLPATHVLVIVAAFSLCWLAERISNLKFQI
jgi:4-amino-4-deoxy-L-arabinose transferase-like glycosyltransferase